MDASRSRPGAACILAGGKSRRLGRDKAALMLGGKPLLARMTELAGRICPEVSVCGRDPGPLAPGIPWFLDETPGLGPLGGIVTALKRHGCSLLVLSCDLPRLDEPTLLRLVQAWRMRPEGAIMTTFQQVETGFIEALVAVYEPQAVPMLARANEEGCRKLSRAVPAASRHCLPYTLSEAGPFFNLNTPQDLARLPG